MNDLTVNDSDYSGIGNSWEPIGDYDNEFKGTFNGDGHTIYSLISRGYPNAGLFGAASDSSIFSNLYMMSFDISGTSTAGALIGYNKGGRIENSCVNGGSIHAGISGGLVGYNKGPIIKSCSLALVGSISSRGRIGGIAGYNDGSIENSYARSTLYLDAIPTNERDVSVGGIVGDNFGDIINSYASSVFSGDLQNTSHGGLIGNNANNGDSSYETTIANSFWDMDTSKQTIGIGGEGVSQEGGIGKTTAEMKKLYTFNSNGGNWDIQGGAPDLNNGYPYLSKTGSSPIWLIPNNSVADTTTPPPASVILNPSSNNAIVSFQIGTYVGSINTLLSQTVVVTVPVGTDISSLPAPVITVSPYATISPASGVYQNFYNNPVTYTVTAQDGSRRDYIVTVRNP
jgi:hypothetical protein